MCPSECFCSNLETLYELKVSDRLAIEEFLRLGVLHPYRGTPNLRQQVARSTVTNLVHPIGMCFRFDLEILHELKDSVRQAIAEFLRWLSAADLVAMVDS
jgi:hypothetical protein